MACSRVAIFGRYQLRVISGVFSEKLLTYNLHYEDYYNEANSIFKSTLVVHHLTA